ncbi:MAG: hypothetical protein IKN09_02070 [Clostridia bacterium]|nr:hypothetical protein [Clostridia bacterium]
MRKIVTFIGVVTLAFTAITAISNIHTTNVAAASNLRYVGDVNEDGNVDAKDASIILTTYSSLSTGADAKSMQELADVNHDGYINAKDASTILKLYSVASTGEPVEYEFVFVDNSTTTTSTTTEVQTTSITTTAASKISEGSVMELVSGSWYIHSEITDNLDDKLYENKAFLVEGDKFVIIDIKEDYWYASILDGDDNTPVYLRIPNEYMSSNFKKIGQMVTSTESTTTTATTTTSVVSTTITETTSSSSTTTETTTIESATTTIRAWTAVKFTGTRAQIRTSPKIPADNPESNFIRFIHANDILFIKSFAGEGWYQITTSNGLENNEYVYINGWDFVVEDNPVYQFIGISWNVRKDKSTESDILETIEYGDLFEVLEIDSNGWAKCKTNKVNGEGYILVDAYNFIRLS